MDAVPPWLPTCRVCRKPKAIPALVTSAKSPLGVDRLCRECDSLRRSAQKLGVSVGELRAFWLANTDCAICGATDDLVADHDHATGRLRAALCRTCNAGLGLFNDDPLLLSRAACYLMESVRGQGDRLPEASTELRRAPGLGAAAGSGGGPPATAAPDRGGQGAAGGVGEAQEGQEEG